MFKNYLFLSSYYFLKTLVFCFFNSVIGLFSWSWWLTTCRLCLGSSSVRSQHWRSLWLRMPPVNLTGSTVPHLVQTCSHPSLQANVSPITFFRAMHLDLMFFTQPHILSHYDKYFLVTLISGNRRKTTFILSLIPHLLKLLYWIPHSGV